MANPTHDTTHTRLARQRGPEGHHEYDRESAGSAALGGVSLAAGILGVLAGIVPLLGLGALFFAVVAFATGIPTMRAGAAAPGYRYARIGVVLAVIAVILGVLNLAIQLELFDYFTTGDSIEE